MACPDFRPVTVILISRDRERRPLRPSFRPGLLLIENLLLCRDLSGLNTLRKSSILLLPLGGAAIYRCDNWLVFMDGFSRCGLTARSKRLFPHPLRTQIVTDSLQQTLDTSSYNYNKSKHNRDSATYPLTSERAPAVTYPADKEVTTLTT